MKKFNLEIFLNNFYREKQLNSNKKVVSRLKIIYGLNFYSCVQICNLIGFKYNINSNNLSLLD